MQPGTDQEMKGIVGSVLLGEQNITVSQEWFHRPFLTGELLQVYTAVGAAAVTWTPTSGPGVSTGLTWFQTKFAYPLGNGAVVVNMSGAGRGHVYINGVDMGRYWAIEQGGAPVQQYYYVPRDMLTATNTLVVCEELGMTDLAQITIALSNVQLPPL